MKNDDENARKKLPNCNMRKLLSSINQREKKCDLYIRAFTDITHIDSQSGTQKLFQNGTELKCLRKMRLTTQWMEAYSNTFAKCITKEKRAGMEQKELNYQMRRTSQWINGNVEIRWKWECLLVLMYDLFYFCVSFRLYWCIQYRWFGFGKWTMSSEYLNEMHHPLNLFISL